MGTQSGEGECNMSQIQVRHVEPDDYCALHDVFAQPNVIAGTLQLPFPSLERSRKRTSETDDGRYRLVAVVDDKVVGMLSLLIMTNPRRRHTGSIGMAVHDAYQGRGVGSALMEKMLELADNWLNLERIELTVFTDNERAVRLYQRFGFEIEGTLQQYAFRDGALVDAYSMARLRTKAMTSRGNVNKHSARKGNGREVEYS